MVDTMDKILWHCRETRQQTVKTNIDLSLGFGFVELQRDLVFREPSKYKSLRRITSEKSRKHVGTRICDDLLIFMSGTCYKRRYVPQDDQT
jgi:hypothetical protein